MSFDLNNSFRPNATLNMLKTRLSWLLPLSRAKRSRLKEKIEHSKIREFIEKSGAFDAQFYLKKYADVRANGIDPIEHYIKYGAYEGRNPNLQFDSRAYLASHPDIAADRLNPLYHHLTALGTSANRLAALGDDKIARTITTIASSGLFDLGHYKRQRSTSFASIDEAISDYLKFGSPNDLQPNKYFDPYWYRMRYPDVAAARIEPLFHYIENGYAEGRLTHPILDLDYYRAYHNCTSTDNRSILLQCINTGSENQEGFSAYADWIRLNENHASESEDFEWNPLVSVLMPTYNTPARYLTAAIESVLRQTYTNFELCIADDFSTTPEVKKVINEFMAADPRIKAVFRKQNGHISAASNSALALATGEFVALLDHDDELHRDALACIVRELNHNPDLDIIYTDEDRITPSGERYEPYFKPEWDEEFVRAQNFVCHLTTYRRSLLNVIEGFRSEYDGSQDYDLILRARRHTSPRKIAHIPKVLYHWRAIPQSTASGSADVKPYANMAAARALSDDLLVTGELGRVQASLHPAFHRIRYAAAAPGTRISLVFDAVDRDCDDVAARLRDAYARSDAFVHEIILIHEAGFDPSVAPDEFKPTSIKLFVDDHPDSNVRCFRAAQLATGDLICFISARLRVSDPTWIGELNSLVQRSAVGLAGAALHYPDGRLFSVGRVKDANGTVAWPHRGLVIGRDNDFGYFGKAATVHSVSTLPILGTAIRRPVLAEFIAASTAQPTMEHVCDWMRTYDYRVIWTPYAKLEITAEFEANPHLAAIDDPIENPNLTVVGPELRPAVPSRQSLAQETTSIALNLGQAADLIRTNGLFLRDWYLVTYPDIAAAGVDPLRHYVENGEAEGRFPNPLFDPLAYRTNNPDCEASGLGPLAHYFLYGAREGRRPSPEFNVAAFRTLNLVSEMGPTLPAAYGRRKASELTRVALDEAKLLVSASGLFSAGWYYREHPDVLEAGVDALEHYLSHGHLEGRRPNPHFDPVFYRETNRVISVTGMEPLTHFVLYGSREGRRPASHIDLAGYILANPALARSDVSPLAHLILRQADGRGADASISGGRVSDHPPLLVPDFFALRGLVPGGAIAVVVHVYHPDVWSELHESISRIPYPFDLFVTLVKDASCELESRIKSSFPRAFVFIFPQDRGRDIARLWALMETGALFKYELICKLHSKRSTYVEDGDRWRRELVEGILQSPTQIRMIVENFREKPDLGIVVADGNIFSGEDRWSGNEHFLDVLLPRLGMSTDYKTRSFPGGGMFWIRPLILRTLLGVGIDRSDFEPEPMPVNGALGHALERLYGLVCEDAGMQVVEVGQLQAEKGVVTSREGNVSIIALFLPQFHPIPENDAWWGKGFTEWTNVSRAKPLFAGHMQPKLPAELGFYDLRLPEVRSAQAELARSYGIAAFCYYYYWFDGQRLLERPLDEIISRSEPEFPFLICWANEPWSRNWDGLDQLTLMPQTYKEGWQKKFVQDVLPIINDRRYYRHDGKPMLYIYRVRHLPETKRSLQRLRDEFRAQGLDDIHLGAGYVDFPNDEDLPPDPAELGLDSFYEFPPHRVAAHLLKPRPSTAPHALRAIFDYGLTATASIERLRVPVSTRVFRGVMAGFDNTARRNLAATVFYGATPANFRRWLRAAVKDERMRHGSNGIVFVNAWNEWAEGTTLEPDGLFGRGWLEAVASANGLSTVPSGAEDVDEDFPRSQASFGATRKIGEEH